MILLYFLLAALVFSDDRPATPPLFTKELCLAHSGLACLTPKQCRQGKLDVYKHPEDRPLCDMQMIIRQFDATKTLIEIWAEGSTITFKYPAQVTIIGFEVKGGIVQKTADMTNNNFKLLESAVDGNKFYVKFNSDNFPVHAKMKPTEKVERITIDTAFSYFITRGDLSVPLNDHLESWCLIPNLKPLTAVDEIPDSYLTELPTEDLFRHEITCDQSSELFYKESTVAKKALVIGCEIGAVEYQFKITKEDKSTFLVPRDSDLEIGCLHKNCLACSKQKLPCAGTDCKELQSYVTDDGCPVHFCPRFLIQTLDGIVNSNITCAKTEEDSFAWSANNKKLTLMKCAKQAPCHLVSTLECEDTACSMVTNIMDSHFRCKNNKQMYLESIGGTKTPIEEITCNSETGRYMRSNVDEIPEGAKVICEDTKGSALSDQPTTGGMTYVGAGVAGLVVLIIVIVLAVVCIRKSLNDRGVAPVGTTTRQETAVSGATSKSSEAAKRPSEMPVTPGAPADPELPPLAPSQPPATVQ